jgi:hypothetical protein
MIAARWLFAVLILLMLHATTPQSALAAGQGGQAIFPLHTSESGKYLEDASGRPFLVNGDTAWSLIVQLRRDEVEEYLADRKRRGFNALLINLVEHKFANKAPANVWGDPPFEATKPFKAMNPAYFDHAAWVLRRAEELGFEVFLAPAYLGVNGGGEGWFREAVEAGQDGMRQYGMFIARRFLDRKNIIWVHGGDFDAPDKALVRAIVSGIEQVAKGSLHTVHSARDTATAVYWAGEAWLSLDTVYTYDDMGAAVRARTGPEQTMPVIAIEGSYESEQGADEVMLRRQAYGAILSGAAGHIFGNNPIWHFDGPGLYAAETTWKGALGSRGSESMRHFRAAFEALPWWLIVPGDRSGGIGYAATTSDGAFQIAYIIDDGGLSFDLPATGRRSDIRWFDPSNGQWHQPSQWPESEDQRPPLRPPASRNSAGDRDWMLVMRLERQPGDQ